MMHGQKDIKVLRTEYLFNDEDSVKGKMSATGLCQQESLRMSGNHLYLQQRNVERAL